MFAEWCGDDFSLWLSWTLMCKLLWWKLLLNKSNFSCIQKIYLKRFCSVSELFNPEVYLWRELWPKVSGSFWLTTIQKKNFLKIADLILISKILNSKLHLTLKFPRELIILSLLILSPEAVRPRDEIEVLKTRKKVLLWKFFNTHYPR